ncbi:(Fe-S)-binding protein [Desulfobacterium sp. N47]|uniref:(Fe-S)-binding protein n=1 Tax=Desulfobacterium sp. N47 TaxID=3115210 RepID=UPI003C9E9F6D
MPRTNCRECGQSTCMVFSALVADGAKGSEDCPQLIRNNKIKLEEYLNKFKFEAWN